MSSSVNDRKLFIGGLSWSTTSETLRTAFEKYGKVEEAKVIAEPGTGRSRGFGAVTYLNESDALAAYKGMHGVELEGRFLFVDRYRDGQERDRAAYRSAYGDRPYEGGRRGPSDSGAAPYGREAYDREYDSRGAYDRGGYDRMAYDVRGAGGYPESAGSYGGYGARASGPGGYGVPPPRGAYPGGRGGYPGGRGGSLPLPPPYPGAAGRGGFGGYDPYGYGAAAVRGVYDARMDYYGDAYGRGRGGGGAFPAQHSAYGRRARPYDYPPSAGAGGYSARPYDSRYPPSAYDERDLRGERDHFGRSAIAAGAGGYDDQRSVASDGGRSAGYDHLDSSRSRGGASASSGASYDDHHRGDRDLGRNGHHHHHNSHHNQHHSDERSSSSGGGSSRGGYADERDSGRPPVASGWGVESTDNPRGWGDAAAKDGRDTREREREREREKERERARGSSSGYEAAHHGREHHHGDHSSSSSSSSSSGHSGSSSYYGRTEKEGSAAYVSGSSSSRGYADRDSRGATSSSLSGDKRD